MAASDGIQVQYEVNGLDSLREIRDATAQPLPHSHNEIEVLLLERGNGVWLMGGEIITFSPGRLTVFWAVRPHQLIKSSRNTVVNCLTIPLAVFTEWKLPEVISKALLAGRIVVDADASFFDQDRRAFANWHQDLKSGDRERQRLTLLEIEARLGRLAFTIPREPAKGHSASLPSHGHFRKISQIVDYVSRHYSEPLSVPQIARAAGMNPTSATKLFKRICGMKLVHYLAQHRILQAQRLLAGTDMKILDVAFSSGYRSASRFYAAFKQACGVSPQEFRRSFDLRRIPLERRPGVWKVGRSWAQSGDAESR